ncbi:hypothetical protein ANN_09337 [Periplaneta americana]|uniref:Uncharacterized protein n=1 Tax=Periplaneta americana TaxID=6978 RepID=A0ABQ8TNA1_PERAM|nr:hypothetical protein ANN_09337 [Periplaneta americana]
MTALCEGGNEPAGSLKAICKGVVTYSEDPKNISWISNRRGISSSEWTNAIKMSTNIAAVRSVPGRSFQDQKCRHPGCSEVETLGHVLGYCPKGELLRNNRHHKVRSSIATTLRKAKWEVYEEVHCLTENGSTRRTDIVAIDRRNQRSLILDPTVRFEKDDQQANNVDNEKKSIYNPCIPHFNTFDYWCDVSANSREKAESHSQADLMVIEIGPACYIKAREGPKPTSRLLPSRPHAKAEVDDHPTRMAVSCG